MWRSSKDPTRYVNMRVCSSKGTQECNRNSEKQNGGLQRVRNAEYEWRRNKDVRTDYKGKG